jgi:hypothetical protein
MKVQTVVNNALPNGIHWLVIDTSLLLALQLLK